MSKLIVHIEECTNGMPRKPPDASLR
jgi:hypothetical protein